MLFNIYGENAMYQLLGWVLVFAGLVICNEIARRSKAGGAFFFFVLPIALTIYFIAIAVGAANGAEWALNNQTHQYMNGWLCSSYRMYWLYADQVQVGNRGKAVVSTIPICHRCN